MSSQRTTWSSLRQFFNLPLATQQTTALLRAPRTVPDAFLRFTDPLGPMPVVVKIPSRDQGRHIPVYLWVPHSNGQGAGAGTEASSPRKIPINLDFHGGGFVMGSCLEQAPFCSKLAREAGVIAVSVDYRLGPLDKFPAAVHDAEDVLSAILHQEAPGWATLRQAVAKQAKDLGHAAHFEPDPSRVSLSGFSSGGNLALNLLLSIEDWPSPFAKSSHNAEHIPALLFFPSLDSRQLPHERPRPEGMGPSKPSFFDDALAKMMDGSYLPSEMRSHPRASPGLAALRTENDGDETTGLHERTRALLVLPELDNLAHQSAEWLKAVEEAGRSEAVKAPMRKETRMRKSSLLAPAPSSSFGTPYRPRPFSHLWAPQPTAFSKGIGSSSRPFSTALAQSPSSDPTWPSPWNSSVITSLATAFQRKAYSSSTVAANLDPMTTGAWSNLELDPRGVDHSVFEEASGEYEATLPATPNKAARSAIRIIASLINTDMAAATQAHEQLKEMGTEFDEKAAPVFARAAAQCAASPDQGQDAVRWLAAIPPKFSFSSLHQTQVAELFHLITFTLTLLKHGAENTDRARHLAMALHIVVARGLHLFRTGPGNELRRMIQRCFMDIVRYTTLTPSSTGIPPLAAVPPSWLEWKNLEDALFEREDDASLGADEHPALFRNRNALSPPLVSAKFRSSIFRNSIRVLAGSLRQRDALFWALRSSSIDEGASQDTDLDAFTVKVLVEETLKRPQDDLETMRLLDVLLSRLEVAKRDAVKPIDKMHFEGLLTAATNAYHASRETSSRKQSATGSISAEIKALVHEGDLRTAAAKACDVLRHRDVASFPNSSSLSKLLGALEANDLSDLASHLRQLMRSSRPGTGQDVITSVLGCIQLGQHSKAIATWRSYFADDAGVCDDVCSIALGIPPQELATQGVESAATSLGYKVWPRRGDVMVMLRALVGATIERYPASLEDLYQAWLAAAFDVPSPSTADQVTSGKVWRQGSVLIGGPCFDVFVAAFARTDKGTAVPRLMSIMQDMKDRGVQPTISTWTKLLETLAKEEVLREEPAEEPLSRTRAQGKSHSRFDGVEIDAEDIPAAATTTDSSPGWASTTMKLARSMGVGARDGAPEPHMPRASMITYVSLIGGLLAGPSMKRWRALGLCLDIRRHLQAEARRGVTFTTQDLERDPRAQKVLARVSWLESRCRVHGPGGQLESEGRTAGAV